MPYMSPVDGAFFHSPLRKKKNRRTQIRFESIQSNMAAACEVRSGDGCAHACGVRVGRERALTAHRPKQLTFLPYSDYKFVDGE